MATTATAKFTSPLAWPAGWQRTRPQDQRAAGGWKRTAKQYQESIAKELMMMGATETVISYNVTGPGTSVSRDVGVSVYFALAGKEDFSWQDALGITDPAPTVDQINAAFRQKAQIHHPDRGGDMAIFQALSRHRKNAIEWATGAVKPLPYVIANDQFKEVRLNLAAIAMSLKALRQLDRCGSTGLLERAFKGFTAIPENAESLREVGR